MDTKTSSQPGMPELKPEVLRSSDEGKKAGFLSLLLAKFGLGGASGGLSAGASFAGMMTSKAGLVALVLAGSSIAGGIGMLATSERGGASRPSKAGSPFASLAQEQQQPEGSMAEMSKEGGSQGQASAEASGASSSLEYFNQANKSAVPDPSAKPDKVSDAAGAASGSASASEPKSSGVQAPDHGSAPGASPSAAHAERPKMVKGDGFGGRGGVGGSGMQLAAQPGLAGGIGGGFDQVYRAPQRGVLSQGGAGGARSMAASRRSSAALSSGLASKQAADTSRITAGAKKSPAMERAATYGAVYDGSGTGAGQLGGGAGTPSAGAGGAPSEGKVNPSTVQNLRETPAPPKPDESGDTGNQTPYQGLIYGAMAAMAVSFVCLLAAGYFANKATKTGVTPVDRAAALNIARILAGVATVAAGIATVLGIMLMMKPYNQTGQGMMFTMIGGILTFQAGMVFIKDQQAYSEASAQVDADAGKAAETMNLKLDPSSVNHTSGAFQGTDANGAMQPGQIKYPGTPTGTGGATTGAGPSLPKPTDGVTGITPTK